MFTWPLVITIALMTVSCGPKVSSQTQATAVPPQVEPPFVESIATLSPRDAVGFTVSNSGEGLSVMIRKPWPGAAEPVQIRLVPRTTDAPSAPERKPVLGLRQTVEIPVQRFAALSASFLPPIERLGLLDGLVAAAAKAEIYSPAVRLGLDSRKIQPVGIGPTVNREALLRLGPDVVFTYGLDNNTFGPYASLLEAGIPVVPVPDFLETTPLGRAEWILFFGLFFNRTDKAVERMEQIRLRYTELKELVKSRTTRPTVMIGSSFAGSWYVPGGDSSMAQLIKDAGGQFLWSDLPGRESRPMAFEAVLARGQKADYWINPGQWETRAMGLAEDARYAQFEAFQRGKIYNNNRRRQPDGASDFWETGWSEPEAILADLVAIFHPDLLPEHQPRYYQRLE